MIRGFRQAEGNNNKTISEFEPCVENVHFKITTRLTRYEEKFIEFTILLFKIIVESNNMF